MIITVPHTGTRFGESLTGFSYMHSYQYVSPEDVADRSGGILLSTLRDPAKVWGTWHARYSGGHSYILDPDHPKSMESAWRGLAALDRIFDIFYLPVDIPGVRDERLAELSELIGKPLETDWAPEGEYRPGKKREDPPEKDLQWIYDLPMVRRYYA